MASRSDATQHQTCEAPPLSKKLEFAAHVYSLQTVLSVPLFFRGWHEYFYPPTGGPDIVKAYECRPYLPIRVFFPANYDQTSPRPLPTVFTIHGGGFCVGANRDDDEYNRDLADSQGVLVVSLNYPKAPAAVFPTAVHDLEALYHAVVADESLPLARARGRDSVFVGGKRMSRLALLGFSAGGNLALALAQLPSLRASPNAPAAVVSVCGCLDLARPPEAKQHNRYYKPTLPLPQGSPVDARLRLAPACRWSYVPYGHDLADPLLSPARAPRDALPPHVFLVAAELDMLAHESWRLACRLAVGRGPGKGNPPTAVPDPDSKADDERCPGRPGCSPNKGALEPAGDARFAWQATWADGSSVGWLLVPDVVHGFDRAPMRAAMGDEAAVRDAALKTQAYVAAVGAWLHSVVWV